MRLQNPKMTQDTPPLPPFEPSPVPQLLYSCKQHKDMIFCALMCFIFVLQFGIGVTLAVFQMWLPAAALFFSVVFTFTLLIMVIPKRLEVWSDGVKVVFSCFSMFLSPLTL